MNPKLAILSLPLLKTKLATAVAEQRKFLSGLEDLEIHLSPNEFIGAAQTIVSRARGASEIAKAKAILSGLQGEGAEAGRQAALATVHLLAENFRLTLPPLLQAAIDAVNAGRDNAVDEEKRFFARHELGHEETSLSRGWRLLDVEVKRLQSSLTPTPQPGAITLRPNKNYFRHVIQWFTVT